MRKIIALFLSLSMLICAAACAKKEQGTTETPSATSESGTPSATSGTSGSTDNAAATPAPTVAEPEEIIVKPDNQPGEYLVTLLSVFVETGTYYIKQIVEDDTNASVLTELAVSGNKIATKTDEGTKIIEDDQLYFVLPEQKAVLTSPVAQAMKDDLTRAMTIKTEDDAKAKFIGSGTETLKGTEYTYEEYNTGSDATTRYYFDDKTLRFVKNTTPNGATLMEILQISKTIPDGFFDIPDGYVVQDLSKMSQ